MGLYISMEQITNTWHFAAGLEIDLVGMQGIRDRFEQAIDLM